MKSTVKEMIDRLSESMTNQDCIGINAMETKLRLESDLKDALRAGDSLRKNTLRLALSSIRLAEIDRGSQLDESAVIAILQKEIKARHESIEDAQPRRPSRAGRGCPGGDQSACRCICRRR